MQTLHDHLNGQVGLVNSHTKQLNHMRMLTHHQIPCLLHEDLLQHRSQSCSADTFGQICSQSEATTAHTALPGHFLLQMWTEWLRLASQLSSQQPLPQATFVHHSILSIAKKAHNVLTAIAVL